MSFVFGFDMFSYYRDYDLLPKRNYIGVSRHSNLVRKVRSRGRCFGLVDLGDKGPTGD